MSYNDWWNQTANYPDYPEQTTYQEQLPPPPPKNPPVYVTKPLAAIAAVAVGVAAVSGVVGGVAGSMFASDTVVSSAGINTSDGSIDPANFDKGTVESAAAIIGPSVVTIEVRAGQGGGSGSGVVLKEDGYILTNNHVVEMAASGGQMTVVFSDGSTADASLVGRDPSSDIAVIKVDRDGLKAATFADSNDLNVGQAVIAVGAPLGLSNTVTEGIVSTLHRPVSTGGEGGGENAVLDAIQTDAAINPGNSGGALVDLAGRVVGINSAIATTGGEGSGNIGVGFAIPSNEAVRVATELIANGKASHAVIGVNLSTAQNGARGATVGQVNAGGPAAAAGLEPGDVIVKVDDRTVTDSDSLVTAIRSHNPGDSVTITYQRGGNTETATATLAASQ